MTKYDVPAEAFRKDRQMLHDIEPAPITDHLTIERRLSRLEDTTAALVDHNKSHGDRIAELERKVARLEAWTREEIFIRTAMDEPDPESMTAGEGDDWEAVDAQALATAIYKTPIDQDTGMYLNMYGAKRVAAVVINYINRERGHHD